MHNGKIEEKEKRIRQERNMKTGNSFRLPTGVGRHVGILSNTACGVGCIIYGISSSSLDPLKYFYLFEKDKEIT